MPAEFIQNKALSSYTVNQSNESREVQTDCADSSTETKTSTKNAKETEIAVMAELSTVSTKRTLPPHQTTRSKTSTEVDAILARKISSTDLACANERPFVANKIIRPPPKTSTSASPKPYSIDEPIKEDAEQVKVTEDEQQTAWRDVGEVEVLRRTKCRRVYAKQSQEKDVALFYKAGTFYALEAWCSHMGKL